MQETDYLSDFHAKTGVLSVLEPMGTFKNNPSCAAIMSGLTDAKDFWKVGEGDLILPDSDKNWGKASITVFNPPELKDDMIQVFKLFFSKKYKDETEPDMDGTVADEWSNIKLTTADVAFEIKPQTKITWTLFTATDKVYPIQFVVDSEQVTFDTELPFDKKEMLWMCLRPGGFILSFTMEEFGVFNGIFNDVLKRMNKGVGKDAFHKDVEQLFKPTMQDRIYKAFAGYYKYMKEKDLIETSYIRL